MTLVWFTGHGEVCVGVCICVHICTYVRVCMYVPSVGMYVCFRRHAGMYRSLGKHALVGGWMNVLVPVPGVRSAGGSQDRRSVSRMELQSQMNCWAGGQAGWLAVDVRKDGLWPRLFSGTRPQLTRVQTSGVHVGCGPRTKEKMGIWHGVGDGDGDGGRVQWPIGGEREHWLQVQVPVQP